MKLRLVLPLLQSKKNDVVVRKRKRKRRSKHGEAGSLYYFAGRSSTVMQQERAIRDYVLAAIGAHRAPLFSGSVAIDLTWSVPSRKLLVSVRPLPDLKLPDDGHDLVNMLDTLCDALQGAAYANDRQVRAARLTATHLTVAQLQALDRELGAGS